MRTATDTGEHRALAELGDKPWAAEDGELWHAAFPLQIALHDATAVELVVAPDIIVALRGAGTPLASAPAPRRSARAAARDVARLGTAIQAAEVALERERERRAELNRKLDEERAESRRLRAELGGLQAQLELAAAAQAEAAAASAELESARRELEASQRRHESLRREHREAMDAQARDRTVLSESSGELESTREALSQERAQTRRLRARLADTGTEDPTVAQVARDSDTRPRPARARREPYDAEATPAVPRTRRPDRDLHPTSAPVPRARPLNPSLRHRTNWLGRVLALFVMLVVIAAIVLVIRTTIKP